MALIFLWFLKNKSIIQITLSLEKVATWRNNNNHPIAVITLTPRNIIVRGAS